MTAEEILKIKIPERLFEIGKEEAINSQFRKLISIWHPDICKHPSSSEVSSHLNELKNSAIQKVKNGTWSGNGNLIIIGEDGKKYEINYVSRKKIELGEEFIGRKSVVYIIDKQYNDLIANGLRAPILFKYSSESMQKEIEKYLPNIQQTVQLNDGNTAIVISKNIELISLEDLIRSQGGKIDPKHVAWILSSLYNLICYFNFTRISHNAIISRNYFVSPKNHWGALLGGWWYVSKFGEKLKAVPKETYNTIQITGGEGNVKTDLEMIKYCGREMLGDLSGARLLRDKSVPDALARWLTFPSSGDSIKDYTTWQEKIIIKSFGVREFTKWNLTPKDVYLSY